MSQHFLLTRQAKTLSLAQVFRMSDEEAETTFRRVRWADTDGAPVCPHCGGLDAYDCRRPDKFRGELIAALQIVDRGDMAPAEMHGAWAGEIGQTQFLPSSYLKYAVDYEGNGRRDLIHSVPDVLASTANYLKGYGWQRGQPWGEGSANFQVLLQWNSSQVYTKTVAYFAQEIAGSQ